MPGGPIVFVHSSDELYGADRLLLLMHAALPPEVRARAQFWLPVDLAHGPSPLCVELERRGATVRHLDLPILRRAYRSPRGLLALLARCARLVLVLLQVRPEMVYCTTSAAFLVAPLAAVVRVPRIVGHVQELWSGGDRRVLGLLARCCDTLLAISHPVQAALPERLRPRTVVVVNATPEPDQHVGLEGRTGAPTYVVASRWNDWKGHRTLLAAWDLVDEPGTLLVLGGPPPSGAAVDVPGLVSGLRFPHTVRVIGEVAEPSRYVEEADAVIVPSDSPEPFGLVAVEALARGRPVLGTAAGGLADIITDGSDGWVYPLGDAQALAHLLRSLTREQIHAAGSRARATYLARFTPGRYSADWLAATGPF